MDSTNWLKQGTEPLFESISWSEPQSKKQAGKILLLGGSASNFNQIASLYTQADKNHIGEVKVIVPQKLANILPPGNESIVFAPQNSSGSFSSQAKEQIAKGFEWADGVIITDDIGHSSETIILIHELLTKYHKPIVISDDLANHLMTDISEILQNKNLVVVLYFGTLLKLNSSLKRSESIKSTSPIELVVSYLNQLTTEVDSTIILRKDGIFFVSKEGRTSTTKSEAEIGDNKLLGICAKTIQNPEAVFEAITTAILLD